MRATIFLGAVLLVGAAISGCGGSQTPAAVVDPSLSEGTTDPKALLATLDIQSSPQGLDVLLDGKPVGKTPTVVESLKAGNYDVTYKDDINGDVTLPIQLGEGEYRTVKHNVVPRADRPAPANARQ